jgi:hypothetical protein
MNNLHSQSEGKHHVHGHHFSLGNRQGGGVLLHGIIPPEHIQTGYAMQSCNAQLWLSATGI